MRVLWFDAEATRALRTHPAFRLLLAERELLRVGADHERGAEEETSRDVNDVLAFGSPVVREEIEAVFVEASRSPDSRPPLVLLQGDLQLVFDEIETLRATVGALRPIVGEDKALRDALDAANPVLEPSPFPQSADIADRLTNKILHAFAQQKRSLTPEQLRAIITRMLIEQRSYQKRSLFGDMWIRALFSADRAHGVIPCYLPSALGSKLPLFPSLQVRLLADVDERQDPLEACPQALRAIAVARLLSHC